MDKFFRLKENHTTVRTEILAGITTFMAMAYILMVNAGMFGNLGEGMYNAVYIATAISAVIGTLLIGLMARLPLAQASGMGLNAFFVYTVCFGMGFSYANALVMVLVDGIVFVLLTVTGLRKIIFEAIPKSVKTAISAGIGLFIAFLGLQNAGLVVNDDSTLVNLHSFNVVFGDVAWADIMPLLITVIAVIAIGAMRALADAGLRVPEDVSIIGYDGLKIGSFYTPKLTTIAQHVELLARRGFDILMRCMEQNAPARHVTVPFTLSVRESVRNITE